MTDQNEERDQTSDTPPDAAPELSAQADSPDPVPDAIKALGTDAVADVLADTPPTAGGGDAPADAEVVTIKEPSMDFLQSAAAEEQAVAHPAEFPQLVPGLVARGSSNIDLLLDVNLPVSIELGRTTLPISDILNWTQGSIVELDKLAGEPVNLMVNNRLVARGEVVVVDENFGLRITSLVSTKERIESL